MKSLPLQHDPARWGRPMGDETGHPEQAEQAITPRATSMLFVAPVHGIADGTLVGGTIGLMRPGGSWDVDAEGTGTGAAGEWRLAAACFEAAGWNAALAQRAATARLPVSVAMPAGLHWRSALPMQVQAALQHSSLPADLLELRLSGRLLQAADAQGLAALRAVRELGAGLSMPCDGDEGQGLQIDRRLPATTCRLPAALVSSLASDGAARAQAAWLIEAAHGQGARVVAAGVETAAQREILGELGCDAGQGSLFGQAMPADLFRACLWPSLGPRPAG